MSADSRDIEQFLFREAQLLDEARFEEWLKLFTDTAWYWVPVSPDQPDPFEMVSIIYDDRRLLETGFAGCSMPIFTPRSRAPAPAGSSAISSSRMNQRTMRQTAPISSCRRAFRWRNSAVTDSGFSPAACAMGW